MKVKLFGYENDDPTIEMESMVWNVITKTGLDTEILEVINAKTDSVQCEKYKISVVPCLIVLSDDDKILFRSDGYINQRKLSVVLE